MAVNDTKDAKQKLTKRQKRKSGPNPSNTWPQQPKIKSETARNKAYLANAGFTTKSNSQQNARGQKRKAQPLDTELDVLNSPEFKFGRLLASPEARTRHATILKLQAYLQARCAPFSPIKTSTTPGDSVDGNGEKRKRRRKDGNNENAGDAESAEATENVGHFRGLSELDLLKLWKGLWHTLYLCDGVTVQNEVSKVLAKLMWSLAGTEEQDEYAGRLYLEVDDEDESVEWGGDGSDEEEGGSGGGDKENEVADKKMRKVDAAAIIINQDVLKDEDRDLQDNPSSSSEEGDSNQDDGYDLEDDLNTKHCRGAHLSQLFIRTYFQTLTREWYKMDKYRIDKFYTLTRLILRETYRYMAARHWNLGIVRLFNDALFEEVLRPSSAGGVGGGGGHGVRFHLMDICLEELALVNGEEGTGLKLTEATFLDCLEPYFEMLTKAQDKVVHDRVMDKVVNRFLTEYSVVSDSYDATANDFNVDDDVEQQDNNGDEETLSKHKLVMGEVHVGSVAQWIFELASDPTTFDHYRKELYDAHKTYVRRIKEVGRDVPLDEGDDELSGICEEGADAKDKITEEENMIQVMAEEVEKNEKTSLKEAPKKKKHKSKAKRKEEQNEQGILKKKDVEAEEKSIMTSLKDDKKEDAPKETDRDMPSSKKKRKKKKKKGTDKKMSEEVSDEKEDVVTISVDEQKEAVNAAAELKVAETKSKDTLRKRKEEVIANDAIMETPRKVKFRRMNMSKSYKASMKDLKKIDHKAERTPEKGILMKSIHLNQGMEDTPQSATKKSSGSKKKRKKNKGSK